MTLPLSPQIGPDLGKFLELSAYMFFSLRSDMKAFAPSCFHSASIGIGNANAAPEGGAQAFDNAYNFGCGNRI